MHFSKLISLGLALAPFSQGRIVKDDTGAVLFSDTKCTGHRVKIPLDDKCHDLPEEFYGNVGSMITFDKVHVCELFGNSKCRHHSIYNVGNDVREDDLFNKPGRPGFLVEAARCRKEHHHHDDDREHDRFHGFWIEDDDDMF